MMEIPRGGLCWWFRCRRNLWGYGDSVAYKASLPRASCRGKQQRGRPEKFLK